MLAPSGALTKVMRSTEQSVCSSLRSTSRICCDPVLAPNESSSALICPGSRRAGFAEIMLVVGTVVVLFLLLRLFGFHLIPLDFDDFGGFLRIPDVAVDHVIEYDQTMVGAEYQFRSVVDVGQGVECHVRTVCGAYFGRIVGFLRPRGERPSALLRYWLGGLAFAGIWCFRGFLGAEVHRCGPAWCRHGHPSVLFAVRGSGPARSCCPAD